jgi:tetratricopeptide (TPR) repeat protein
MFPELIFSFENTVEDYLKSGITLFNEGKINEAIKQYDSALKIDPNSDIANYEMAVACYVLEMYEFATKYSTISLVEAKNDTLKQNCYLLLANSLEAQELYQETAEVYLESINSFPKNFQLMYNFSLFHNSQKDYDAAKKYVKKAILLNPLYPDAHVLLYQLSIRDEARIKALLTAYYFLLLEPRSPRASTMRKNIDSIFVFESMTILNKQYKTIDNDFKLEEEVFHNIAYRKIREHRINPYDKTDIELFIEITKELINTTQISANYKDAIWREIYIDKLAKLWKTKNIDTFCYYISQTQNIYEIQDWLRKNPDRIEKLGIWINANMK